MELPEAANALASSLNQFGEGADQAGRFINVLAAGAKEGSSEINETAAALQNAGTVASGANLSFEETNAAIQALAEISVKGSEAGTGLRNVLLTLQSGADDTNPAVVGLETALENLGKKNLSTAELAKMFGKENVVVANQLVNSREKISELTTAMTGTSTAYEQAATNMDNMAGDMKALDSAAESLQITIGKGLNIAIRAGVQFLTALILAIKGAPAFIRENKEAFAALGVAILALNAGNIKTAASTLYHTGVEKARGLATKTSTAYQWLLNAAMTANPIGLVVASVAALVGGFIMLYQRSEAVRGGIAGLWAAFKELLSIAGDIALVLINPLENAGKIKDITDAGDRLGKAFSDGYHNKLKSEKANQDKKEESEHQQAKQKANQKGQEIGKATADGFSEATRKGREEAAKKARQERLNDEKEYLAVAKQIQDLELQLIENETERKIATIRLQAERQKEAVTGTVSQKALQVELIERKLEKDILQIKEESAGKQRQLEEGKTEVAVEEANRRARKAKADLEVLRTGEEGAGGEVPDTEAYMEALIEQLEVEKQIRLSDAALTADEKLLIEEEFEQQKSDIREKFAEAARLKEMQQAEQALNYMQQATAAFFDFKRIQSDKDLAKADKDKQKRLKTLEDEYKGGKISKEQYEDSKSAIESNYDEKTRKLKRKAAEDEKAANITNSIMAGALAVLKASQNPLGMLSPTAIATAIFAGLQTAKIIATPIPAFAKGGFTATVKRKEQSSGSIGTFADGGWVNNAQLGLIGEAGRELVLPNWMVESPKYANIVGWLEQERQKGARAYADGGSTGQPLALPETSQANRSLTDFEKQMLQKMDEVKDEVFKWPSRLQVHNNVGETRDKLQQLNELERRAFG